MAIAVTPSQYPSTSYGGLGNCESKGPKNYISDMSLTFIVFNREWKSLFLQLNLKIGKAFPEDGLPVT